MEFVADKIPWVDSVWDAVHTVIRPVGGALIAVTTLGHVSPGDGRDGRPSWWHPGGWVAPDQGRDARSRERVPGALHELDPERRRKTVFVVGLGVLALKYPIAAAVVVAVCVVLIVTFAAWIVRALRRRFGRPSRAAADTRASAVAGLTPRREAQRPRLQRESARCGYPLEQVDRDRLEALERLGESNLQRAVSLVVADDERRRCRRRWCPGAWGRCSATRTWSRNERPSMSRENCRRTGA